MAHLQHETEIKLPVRNAATAGRMLRTAGFRIARRRVFEVNTIFDTPESALRSAGGLLRVRQAGLVATVTYKGPAAVGRHKSREELEYTAGNAAMASQVFSRLGYEPVFRYEKYRTEYERPRAHGIATIDTTPIGVYMELEGLPDWIDRTAAELGFDESDYITASYGRLYLQWCEERGVTPSNMVF
jgi:adenylate cyclase class 2